TAQGGNGGNANTGNTQIGNGNAYAISVGKDSQAEAKGGDTTASSGDAYGGNGGNATAHGGNANASNNAQVQQDNSSSGSGDPSWDGCKSGCPKGHGSETEQENESTVNQGDNKATGGNAEATGGNGGNANTGNTQEHNSNACAGLCLP